MSGRRGRPPGARPPSKKDLKTPKIGQFFHQQPFAPIFRQRMGGGSSQGAGRRHDHVDLTGGSGESCSEYATSSSAQNNTPTAAEARDSLQQFLATYSDSEEEDGAPSSGHPPSTAGPSHPTPDHETEGVDRADRMEALRRVWTFRVRVGLNSSKYIDVLLDDVVIKKLESIKRRIQSRAKDTDTSFSAEDKTLLVQVFDKVNGMSIPHQYHAWSAHTKCEILMLTRNV